MNTASSSASREGESPDPSNVDREVFNWQFHYLGLSSFPESISALELQAFFRLSPEEIAKINAPNKFAPRFRVALAVQLGFIKMTGNLLEGKFAIPHKLLKYLTEQLGPDCSEITLASLKGIYRRAATLSDHRNWALGITGFRKATDDQFANLQPFLDSESKYASSVDDLVASAQLWMYKNKFLSVADRKYRDRARIALAKSELGLAGFIGEKISNEEFARWEFELLKNRPDGRTSYIEWLQKPIKGRAQNALEDRVEKVHFLRSLGVHTVDLSQVPIEKRRVYAEELNNIKPSKFKQWTHLRKVVRLACYLNVALMLETDRAIIIGGRRISGFVRDAREKADKKQLGQAISLKEALFEIFERMTAVEDETLSRDEFYDWLKTLKAQFHQKDFPTRADAVRWALTERDGRLRPLLNEFLKLDLKSIEHQALVEETREVERLLKSGVRSLPDGFKSSAPKGWLAIIEGPDRERAMRALEAVTLLRLRRALRSGAVYVEHSEQFCGRHNLMIPKEVWESERVARYAQLGLPLDGEKFLESVLADLNEKLRTLSEQLAKGPVYIDHDKVRMPRPKSLSINVDAERDALFAKIGSIQLPDLLLQMSVRTGFHKGILGRDPRSGEELLMLYGGMLAHACALDATQVSLMIPQLTAQQIRIGMDLFDDRAKVGAANDILVSYIKSLPVSRAWGDGSLASADMMSLAISRKVWLAKEDPRTKGPSIGLYVALSDFYSIFWNQPIIINEWQAGPALDCVLRQRQVEPQQMAVDTHGYTNVAMTFFKLTGYNLCPRLAKSGNRKLYIQSDLTDFPAELQPVVRPIVSTKVILDNYDDLVRLASSMKTGFVTATVALARFGSAASDSPLYRAAEHLGRLLRTIYLCDYFVNEELRRTVNRILVHGEAVHTLQRAIYAGSFSKPRKTETELYAMSGSLTLVTNLCIAWTAAAIQETLWGDNVPDLSSPEYAFVAHISPAHYGHINFSGTFFFDVDRYFNWFRTRDQAG